MELLINTAAIVGVVYCCFLLWKTLRSVLWVPWRTKRAFEKQGVKCLPYTPLLGSLPQISGMVKTANANPLPLTSHNAVLRIAPYLEVWKKAYGDIFVFWLGFKATIPITNPEHAKEILSNKFGHFKKLTVRPDCKDLGGESVASLEGERWAEHRRIVSPAFFVEKLKVMTGTMIDCIHATLDKWESQLDGHVTKEIDVLEEFKVLTADIIAHTAFGSSYAEGMQVFKLQQKQQVIVAKRLRSIYIPGFRFLPTPGNRYTWRLNKEIQDSIEHIINSRENDHSTDDLLGILMAANRKELSGSQKNLSLSMKEIVDECKTFFFAGHETTASLMTWTTMLLAMNPEWQERAREEVFHVLSKESPTYNLLNSLKIVGMVLNESLRLYPPGSIIIRETVKNMTLGSLTIPANTLLMISVISLHCDPAFWGKGVLDFNPQRFAEGVGSACETPFAFLPFSMGPRNCLGQNFAMVEARAILAMMLQRFRFSLSPGYTHCPTTVLTLQPQHGMQIIFEKLE
ncbi:hypothetical protein GOP47_0027576 [Adiantum capillus-veneris]|nr:hypothetical protein GOP47_0027576 [Adiantum capillus-veneris]